MTRMVPKDILNDKKRQGYASKIVWIAPELLLFWLDKNYYVSNKLVRLTKQNTSPWVI